MHERPAVGAVKQVAVLVKCQTISVAAALAEQFESIGGWIYHSFRVADFVTPTSSVRLRFVASDLNQNSTVEAAIDDLTVLAPCCPVFAPTEISGLAFDKTTATELSWNPQTGMVFDVIRGDLSLLLVGGTVEDAVCVANDQMGAGWDDIGPGPVAGQTYYYLVRAEDPCNPGTASGYGTTTSGAPRTPLLDCL